MPEVRYEKADVESMFGTSLPSADELSDVARKSALFDLADVPWIFPTIGPNGEGSGRVPETIVGKVDLAAYRAGVAIQMLDFGTFNVMNTKLPSGYHIPRHRHNLDQLVFVVEGEAWLGSRVMTAGQGWYTPAGHAYTVTAGPQGLTYMEIRKDPVAELETEWLEADPAKWVHRTFA